MLHSHLRSAPLFSAFRIYADCLFSYAVAHMASTFEIGTYFIFAQYGGFVVEYMTPVPEIMCLRKTLNSLSSTG